LYHWYEINHLRLSLAASNGVLVQHRASTSREPQENGIANFYGRTKTDRAKGQTNGPAQEKQFMEKGTDSNDSKKKAMKHR
jgi:hypothetical protein